MHTSRVNPAQVDAKRLDPDYYRPEHLETERILKGLDAEPLRQVGSFWAGPFGSELPSSLYLSEGVPLFRVGNVGSMQVLYDGMAYLAPAVHEQLSASEVLPGDLLIVKASVGEKICRIPDSMPKANITQHIIAIRPNGKADSDYVSAFLFGRYGRSQLVRRSLGSIIQYLGVNDARTVLYPPIDGTVQAYIGDKVRLAERLRERAARLQHTIDSLACPQTIRVALTIQDSKSNRIAASELNARLDGKYYGRRAMTVLKASLEAGGVRISELGPKVSNGFEYREFTQAGRPYITVSEVSSGRLNIASAPCIPADVKVPPKATVNERCTFVVRTGSVGIAVKAHAEDAHACISSHLIRLEFDREAQSVAVTVWLNSPAGKCLQEKIAYGGVQPQISQDEVLALPVPPSVLDAADQILGLWEAREQCLRAAGRLLATARALVEALIERRIAEADLMNIQQAIIKGDHTGDRELLGRLTLNGLDAPNTPKLFPNLDVLYRTLENIGSSSPPEAQ